MKRILFIILSALAALVVYSATTSEGVANATGDVWCPSGYDHIVKLDNLSGPTFTVPTPPDGLEIVSVSVKAGTDHYPFEPVTPGQILDVKTVTEYDISHAHLCEKEIPGDTTTTPETTNPCASEGTNICDVDECAVDGTNICDDPCADNGFNICDGTAPPTTVDPCAVGGVNVCDSESTTTTTTLPPQTTVAQQLPKTGSNLNIVFVGALFVLAGCAVLRVRRS